MLHIMLFHTLDVSYCYISTFRSVCVCVCVCVCVRVLCCAQYDCFLQFLDVVRSGYVLNSFEMVPVDSVITGITFVLILLLLLLLLL